MIRRDKETWRDTRPLRWLGKDENTWEGRGRSRWDKDAEEGHELSQKTQGQREGMGMVSRDGGGQGVTNPRERQGHLGWTTVLAWTRKVRGDEDGGEGGGHRGRTRTLRGFKGRMRMLWRNEEFGKQGGH